MYSFSVIDRKFAAGSEQRSGLTLHILVIGGVLGTILAVALSVGVFAYKKISKRLSRSKARQQEQSQAAQQPMLPSASYSANLGSVRITPSLQNLQDYAASGYDQFAIPPEVRVLSDTKRTLRPQSLQRD